MADANPVTATPNATEEATQDNAAITEVEGTAPVKPKATKAKVKETSTEFSNGIKRETY